MANKRIKDLATTITAFRTGDVIPVDGPSGTAKMAADLLQIIFHNQIFAGWGQNISDLNLVVENASIILQTTSLTTTSNIPSDFGNSEGVLVAQKAWYHNSRYQVFQTIMRFSDAQLWTRNYNSHTDSWTAWSKPTSKYEDYVAAINKQIFATWGENIADLNNAPINAFILIQRTDGTTTQHMPSDFDGMSIGLLYTQKAYYSATRYQIYQVLRRFSDDQLWTRYYNSNTNAWTDWTKPVTAAPTIEIGAGKDYSTLRAGFAAAANYKNAKVIVYPGTYDLITECADVLANELTANFSPCYLGAGMHVFFCDGAKVLAINEKGTKTDDHYNSIKRRFEPFSSKNINGDCNFTIENLHIEAKDTRYCLHDDRGSLDIPYVHKIINCTMKYSNSGTTSSYNYVSCIGGGLGLNGTIVIEGGVYECDLVVGRSDTGSGDPDYGQQCIFFHNGNLAGSESSILLKDAYFKSGGYFYIGDFGPSEIDSSVVVTGCRFAYPILHKYETSGTDHENFVVTADWNNVVENNGSWSVSGNTAEWVEG